MNEADHRPRPKDGQEFGFQEWFRTWRYLFGLLVVALGVALFYLIEDWRGEAAWEKYRLELADRGEPTELSAVLPPEVSEGANFAMSPSVAGLNSTTGSVPVSAVSAKYSAATAELKLPKTPRFSSWTWDRTDLLAWAKAFQAAAEAKDKRTHRLKYGVGSDRAAASGQAKGGPGQQPVSEPRTQRATPEAATQREGAARVLAEFEEFGPLFEELEAASQRPHSRFSLDYTKPNPWAIPLPHLGPLKGLSEVLQLRASAELALGQIDDAFKDVKLMLSLSEASREEPFIVSLLVRGAQLQLAMQPLAEGLAGHQWSDTQLRSLETDLGGMDFCGDLRRALVAERLFSCEMIEYVERTRDFSQFGSEPSLGARTIVRLAPSGWFCFEERNLSRAFDDRLLSGVDAPDRQIHPRALIEEEEAHPWQATNGPVPSPSALLAGHRYFSAILVPGMGGFARRAAYAQTAADLAALACALERCRIAGGQLPETLEGLAPDFIERVPHDVISGGPLKYRRAKDGGFVLYSVGWNRADDGGTVGLGHKGEADPKTGDWVWGAP